MPGAVPRAERRSDARVRPADSRLGHWPQFAVGRGQGPHDVAPAADGGVWYTAQRSGELGYLDPTTGATRMVPLGAGSSPHGVIVGPDGAPWVTDSGLNAIVRVDAATSEVKTFRPPPPNVNLNTATFDRSKGRIWVSEWNAGQVGVYDPSARQWKRRPSPRSRIRSRTPRSGSSSDARVRSGVR